MKLARNSVQVPPDADGVMATPAVAFIAADGAERAHYLFTISATQSEALPDGSYITDARVVSAGGAVDYPQPLAIKISGRVTQ